MIKPHDDCHTWCEYMRIIRNHRRSKKDDVAHLVHQVWVVAAHRRIVRHVWVVAPVHRSNPWRWAAWRHEGMTYHIEKDNKIRIPGIPYILYILYIHDKVLSIARFPLGGCVVIILNINTCFNKENDLQLYDLLLRWLSWKLVWLRVLLRGAIGCTSFLFVFLASHPEMMAKNM